MVIENITINDIDVFIFDKVVDRNYQDVSNWINASSDSPKKLFYHKKEKVYYEDYSGLCVTSQSKDFYYIDKTEILHKLTQSGTYYYHTESRIFRYLRLLVWTCEQKIIPM